MDAENPGREISLVSLSNRLRRFQNVFRPHENVKPAFSNSFGLKGVFEKLPFRNGLVWTVGLTVEVVLHFQISLASCRGRPKLPCVDVEFYYDADAKN